VHENKNKTENRIVKILEIILYYFNHKSHKRNVH